MGDDHTYNDYAVDDDEEYALLVETTPEPPPWDDEALDAWCHERGLLAGGSYLGWTGGDGIVLDDDADNRARISASKIVASVFECLVLEDDDESEGTVRVSGAYDDCYIIVGSKIDITD